MRKTNWASVGVAIGLFALSGILMFSLSPVAATGSVVALGWVTFAFLGVTALAFCSLALDLGIDEQDEQDEEQH